MSGWPTRQPPTRTNNTAIAASTWLLQNSGEVLLATDCETQWGADNPRPAEIHLQGTRPIIKYVEFKSSDGCEMYEASLKLSPAIEIEK